ncbi:MAG: hypothetical protein ABH821_00900 [archaeon]
MIDFCIKALINNSSFAVSTQKEFGKIFMENGLLDFASKQKMAGVSLPKGGPGSVHGVLLLASQMGLVKEEEHKKFLDKYLPLIKLESELLALSHSNKYAFVKEILEPLKGKKLFEREKVLNSLIGFDFSSFFSKSDKLSRKISVLWEKHSIARSKAAKSEIKLEIEKLEKRKAIETALIVAKAKSLIARKLFKPGFNQEIIRLTAPSDLGEFSKRQLNFIWDGLMGKKSNKSSQRK